MSKGIVEVAKPNKSLVDIAPKDLSFSSEWETPKIFAQTSSDWTNTLGYLPMFMGFRRLSDDVPLSPWLNEYVAGGFTNSNYTHSVICTQEDGATGITYVGNDLSVNKFYSDYFYGETWSDTSAHALLFLEPLSGTPSGTIDSAGPFLICAKEGFNIPTHPTNCTLDSRFDTLKIFKTGTLTLSLPAETVTDNYKHYSAEVTHGLGYPPVYLPEAGVGLVLGTTPGDGSFTVNDILGLTMGNAGDPMLDVYVDSDKLYLRYTRTNRGFSWVYSAATVTLYYTIFYNPIGEEFNLLP